MGTMYLNQSHPLYSLNLEILATIPQSPGYVVINSMCEDFGLVNQYLILQSIKRFLETGIRIQVRNCAGQRIASIAPECWKRARSEAEEYWDKVYGGEDKEASRVASALGTFALQVGANRHA